MNRRLQFAKGKNWGESTVRAKREKYDAESSVMERALGNIKVLERSVPRFLIYKMGVRVASTS